MKAALSALKVRWESLSGNSQGALLLVANGIIIAGLAIIVRIVGARVPVMTVVFFRNFFALCILLPFVLRARGDSVLRTARPGLHLSRGALTVGSMAAYYWSYGHLPLAESTALMFTMPLFLIIVAALALGEQVRWRRTTATVAGFAGVLVIVQPGSAAFDPALAVPLSVGAVDAVLGVIVKRLTAVDRLLTILFYMVATTLLFAAVPAALAWQTPSLVDASLLFVIAAISTVSQMMTVTAWRVGEATAIAPVNYVQIVLIGLVAYLAFGEVPSWWSFLGAAIIAASTLYIVRREARLKRAEAALKAR
ncbi:MAG: DMT family transporter [Alphaproteobacteria bacterium]